MPYTPYENPKLIAQIEKSLPAGYGENHQRADQIAEVMTGLSDADKGPLKTEYIARTNANEVQLKGADFTDMARAALVETDVLIKPKKFTGEVKHKTGKLTRYKL
jgi:hypothetical protein